MSIVNERMKELRSMSDITLKDMAKRIGVSEATVQRYESGKIEKVPYKAVVEYAKAFNAVPEYVMGWVDNRHQKNPNIYDLIADKDKADKARADMFKVKFTRENEYRKVELTNDEYIIIECYRQLSDSEKEMVKRTVAYYDWLQAHGKEIYKLDENGGDAL